MPSIKIRNLTSATEPEVVSGNFIAAALDENAGLTKSTRKVTFGQVVIGGLNDPAVIIPISTLPVASTDSLGVVQVGANLSITEGGVLSAPAPAAYQLPIASPTVLGGIKVGANLTIDSGGVLSVSLAPGSVTSEALAPGAVDSTTLPLSTGGGLEFDENSNLRIATSSENFNFVLFVNDNTGVQASEVDSSDITTVGSYTALTDRLKTVQNAITWIINNISSSKGTSIIIMETDSNEISNQSALYTPEGLQDIEIWGSDTACYRFYGFSTTNPTSADTRKTINMPTNGLNNIGFVFNSYVKLVLLKMNITPGANCYALGRATARTDIFGVTIKHTGAATINSGIESFGGEIRIRPFQANWRTGLDLQDPFFHNEYLAPLEVDEWKVGNVLAILSSGKINLIEYSYFGYSANQSYTWPARVHFMNDITFTNFIYMEGASTFETNGACATRATNTTSITCTNSIKAVAFCPVLPQGTNLQGSLGTASWPKVPGTNLFATSSIVNVDYRQKANTTLTATNALDVQANYP